MNVVFSSKGQDINYENFYKNLDSTRITTGLLYNQVIPHSSIQSFTGISDTVITNSDNWLELYHELYFSNLSIPEKPDVSELSDSLSKDTINLRIPIGIINMKYNLIKNNAISDSLLILMDSVLWDGPNISESPYTTNRCFAASALINNCPSSDFTFFISDDYLYENTGENILYYQIDFDNGDGPVILYNNDEYSINFTEAGNKIIEINAILENGDTLKCKSSFMANETIQMYSIAGRPPTGTTVLGNEITYKPERLGYLFGTHVCCGYFGVWYGCDSRVDKRIRKPVIFVEGFDPNNTNSFTEKGLFETANQENFVVNLINNGCDVIILNFTNGGGPIQDNAMVLRKLINEVNRLKITNNELVVIGASMGGLVARYALSYMEQEIENHNTRLLITYDTPNQGSYGSLGAQHLLAAIDANWLSKAALDAKTYKQIKDKVDYIDCTAAKQMLVYHHDATAGRGAFPNQLRTDFLDAMAEFPNNGYPQQCRNVAMSCGSGNGTPQNPGLNAGYEQINTNGIVPGEFPFRYELKLNALPNKTMQEILYFDAEIGFSWNLFFLWSGINWEPAPKLSNLHYSVSNTEAYDNCPGGYYEIISSLNTALNKASGGTNEYNYKECFIPTVSALDLNNNYLKSINPPWIPFLMTDIHSKIMGDQSSLENSDKNITPFDAIYVGDDNLIHITGGGITVETRDWMLNEINRDNILINNITFSAKELQFEANNSIIASSTNENGVIQNVIINDGSDITFLAGNSIILNPGFCVESGSTFKTEIYQYNGTVTSSSMVSNSISLPQSLSLSKKKQVITTIKKTNQEKLNKMSISPNPTRGNFNLNVDICNNIVGFVSIYNMMGKLVYQNEMNQSSLNIQIDQPSGVYLLKVQCGDNRPMYNNFVIIK